MFHAPKHTPAVLETIVVEKGSPFKVKRDCDLCEIEFHTQCTISLSSYSFQVCGGQTVLFPMCAMIYNDLKIQEGRCTLRKTCIPIYELPTYILRTQFIPIKTPESDKTHIIIRGGIWDVQEVC